jgi:hypothetical protein
VPGRSLTVVALAAQSNARLLQVSAAITNLFPVWVRHACTPSHPGLALHE